VAKTVSGVNTLDAFLADMHKRYPDSSAVSPEAAARDAAKPQAAAPNPTPAEKDAAIAPAKPKAASSPQPPKAPASTPAKADPSPTGSIRR
jgi:hypothetical protein